MKEFSITVCSYKTQEELNLADYGSSKDGFATCSRFEVPGLWSVGNFSNKFLTDSLQFVQCTYSVIAVPNYVKSES